MGDTTIVIDADAAKYLAGLAKADQANKKTAKSAAAIGDGLADASDVAEGLVGQLVNIGSKTALVAAAGQAVTKTWDHWISRLEKAQQLMEATTKGLQGAAAPSGANVARLRTDLLNQGGTLSLEQKVQAAGAYARAAPGAKDQEILQAAREADQANQAGIDPTEFATGRAKLRSLGANAGDVTAQVLTQGGDQAGQMLEILQTIATRLGPDQAQNAIGLVTGSGQTPGGTALLQSMLGQFLSQGRTGDFAATATGPGNISLAPGLENRGLLRDLSQAASRTRGGSLQDLVDQANQDPLTRAGNLNQGSTSALENNEFLSTAASALRLQAERNLGAAYAPNLPESFRPNFLPSVAADLGYQFPLDPRARDEAQRYRQTYQAANDLEKSSTVILQEIHETLKSNKRLSSANGEPR
jgi:hypothetical protein